MKIPLLAFIVGLAIPVSIFAAPNTSATMVLDANNLGSITYSEWVNGVEKEVVRLDGHGVATPAHYFWSKKVPTDGRPQFGDSKTPGVRYLRIGFGNPVTIGSVLIRGAGQVSVLKPGMTYPGDLANDSQWIPAQRLKAGQVSDAEAEPDDAVLWTLPTAVTTRAIRFTHTAQPNDRSYAGQLAAAIFPARLANLAPQALATTSASDQNAFRLNDENAINKGIWENISSRDGDRPKTIAENPEWGMLVWPGPVTLQGVALLGNQWAAAEIQAYAGPAAKHPREANESDWKTLQTLSGVKPQGGQLDLAPVFFDAPVTTRALRIRFTAALDETGANSRSRNGKRVSLGEWMALEPLYNTTLQTAVIPPAAEAHAPIPVRFTLPDNGEVTLVIEDASGKRIRNLISQTPFPKGDNVVWWDGTDDLGRDSEAANHGLYSIPSALVAPGAYTVRGLWHKPLDLRYEMTVYAPGTPPWGTADGSGGWLTNHTPASCALFVPAAKAPGGEPLVYLGVAVAEGGSALAWLNLDGKKIGGRGWIGGSWTGANYLAGDAGPNAKPGIHAYAASSFTGNKKYGVDGKVEIRLTKLTASGDRPVLTPTYLCDPLAVRKPGDDDPNRGLLGGLAVHNGTLVFSQTALNQLVFIDADAGKILATPPLPSPGVLAFDSQGRLLAISGKSLLRFTLNGVPAKLPTPETLVSNFEDPRGITLDSTDKIYVSDRGNSHQVKVFSPEGKPLAIIGKPGAPEAGPYDPRHMNNPKGLAVDSNGRIWVTEDDFQPKRVSVWNADGTLWKSFYGASRYGGGGSLDPKDHTRFYYDGMEFRLDWKKGTNEPVRVFYRESATNLKLAFRDGPPETPLYINGHRYLTDVYNSVATSGHDTTFLFLDNGDIAVPVAGSGNAYRWDILKGEAFKSRWPQGIDPNADHPKDSAFFIWSDLNGDGQVQPEEVTIQPGSGGGMTIGDDGSFLAARFGVSKDALKATRFKPVQFTDNGVPVYDFAAGEILAPAQGSASDGGDLILIGTDGCLVMTTPPPPFSKLGIGGARNGQPAWSYPSLWPGLHPSHNAPVPSKSGMLIGTTRLLGGLVTPKGEAGPLFFINSNQGNIYAFTQDGLFVAQLFQDMRQGKPWEMPFVERNMSLNDLTLHDENFFPTVAGSPDGTVYINTGGLTTFARVDNIDTIRRIPPVAIQVSSDDLKQARDFVVSREASRQAAQGAGILSVSLRASAPAFDGKLGDWSDAQWAEIDHRGTNAWFNSNSKPYNVSGAVTVAGGKLFVAWRTDDANLLKNAGDAPNGLFKTGGALDLMIGTDPKADPKRAGAVPGDERLVVAQVGGKTRALLYRAVVPGTADKDKVPFNAPWHGITLDRVDDVSAQVELIANGSGNYAIAVPLSVLGLDPKPGMRIKGDIGILRGDGKQTTQRVYWMNKATAIVSDVPTEAELTPGLWGTWSFEQK